MVVSLEGAPREEDVVQAVVVAFTSIGFDKGSIDLALSEHDEDDAEMEAPPFFERSVNLANPAGTPPGATVQVEIALVRNSAKKAKAVSESLVIKDLE